MRTPFQIINILTFLCLLTHCDGNSKTTSSTQTLNKSELAFTLPQEELTQELASFSLSNSQHLSLKLYRLTYQTRDAFDAPTLASAALIIPEGLDQALPLMSIQHGTMFERDSVVSVQGFDAFSTVAASLGYIVVVPDYLGFGIHQGFHPYHHAQSSAQSVMDAIRAARQFCQEQKIAIKDQLFLTGYSEGGYVTMAAHQSIERDFSEEFNLTAVAPMAGAYDLLGTAHQLLKQKNYNSPAFIGDVLYAYSQIYSDLKLVDLLQSPYADLLAELFDGEHSGGEINEALPHNLTQLFNADPLAEFASNPQHPLAQHLAENRVYLFKPMTPTQLVHCVSDDTVPYFNSKVAYQYFKMQGASHVALISLHDGDHGDCAVPAVTETLGWFAEFKE